MDGIDMFLLSGRGLGGKMSFQVSIIRSNRPLLQRPPFISVMDASSGIIPYMNPPERTLKQVSDANLSHRWHPAGFSQQTQSKLFVPQMINWIRTAII